MSRVDEGYRRFLGHSGSSAKTQREVSEWRGGIPDVLDGRPTGGEFGNAERNAEAAKGLEKGRQGEEQGRAGASRERFVVSIAASRASAVGLAGHDSNGVIRFAALNLALRDATSLSLATAQQNELPN